MNARDPLFATELLRAEASSLLRYFALVGSPPQPKERAGFAKLRMLAALDEAGLAALTTWVRSALGHVPGPRFPAEFAGLNDVSLSYLKPRVLADQERLAGLYERAHAASTDRDLQLLLRDRCTTKARLIVKLREHVRA